MNSSASLERGYRRLLAIYPRAFRRENEEEILAVLLATADDDLRRPGLAISADLIRSGLLMRARPSVPHSAHTVRAAVKLMYLAAAAMAGLLVTVVLTTGSLEAAVARADPAGLSGAQTHLLVDKVALPLYIVLLLWLAWAIGRGQDWARLLCTAFFALTSLGLLVTAAQGAASIAAADLIAGGICWAFQLAAVILIFTPQSAPYYRPQPAQRQSV